MAGIVVISLYFVLFWGFDALHMLLSPSYGLEDTWHSQYIFFIGRIVGLGPLGLIELAAFFAAMKLVVACACAWHIADRFLHLTSGETNSEVLEGALILVVVMSIISGGLAVWSSNVVLAREAVVDLLFAAIATALCLVERRHEPTSAEIPTPDVSNSDEAVLQKPVFMSAYDNGRGAASGINVLPIEWTPLSSPQPVGNAMILNYVIVQLLIWAMCGGLAWFVIREYVTR